MFRHIIGIITLSCATLSACTIVDKGGTEGSTGETDGSSGTTSSGTTDDDPSAGTTSAGATDPGTTDAGSTTSDVGEGNPPCVDTPTVLAPDEASPLGFSAEELLAGKLGPRDTELTVASEPLTLSDQWKGKVLPLAVDLRHEGGEVRWIDSEINPDYDPMGNESGFPGECTDRLEVDVEIDFVTGGGELDEHREAILTATTVERATLDVELMPPGLMGTLDLTTIYGDPEWVITGIRLSGVWQDTGAGGSLLNEVHVGGDDGFVGFGPLASWGDPIEFP